MNDQALNEILPVRILSLTPAQMEGATTWPYFDPRISQLQPKDTYTASEPLRTPVLQKKEFGISAKLLSVKRG